MISFVLLFALAFAAFPTDQTACENVVNAFWNTTATPAKCECKQTFTEKTEGTTTTCECKDTELNINGACVTKTTCPGSDASKTLLNTEDNQCVASCKAEQLKIGNECQQKQSCNGASNKPLYNNATNKCEACPPAAPIYHNDAQKCIVQTDCKTENAETLQDTSVANLKMCSCVRSSTYKDGKCNPECGDMCSKPNQKCQFKSDYSDTECGCGNGYQVNTGDDKATNPCVCPTATHEEQLISNVKKCVVKQSQCKPEFANKKYVVSETVSSVAVQLLNKCVKFQSGYMKMIGCNATHLKATSYTDAQCTDDDQENFMAYPGTVTDTLPEHYFYGNPYSSTNDCSTEMNSMILYKNKCIVDGTHYYKYFVDGNTHFMVNYKDAQCKEPSSKSSSLSCDKCEMAPYSSSPSSKMIYNCYQHGTTKCSAVCKHGQHCKNGQCVNNDLPVICDSNCGTNEECKRFDDKDACACKVGFENKPTAEKPNKLNCVQKTCGENEELKGNDCVCKTGFEKKNNKCVKKENNGVNGLFVILAMALFFIF